MDEDIKEEMLEKISKDLGANYNSSDEEVLGDILEEVSSIASNVSNRNLEDEKLWPYIKKATKATYLSRGVEGIQSLNESGVSSSFEDIIEKMRNDIVKNGLRRMK